MQFSQPNGLEYYGQPHLFNTQCQFNGYPVIVGEGTVTSVTSPDGGAQLIFLPTAHWTRPQPAPYIAHLSNPHSNNTAAWFVRCISNPFQPTVFSQPYPALWAVGPYPRASNSDCNLNHPAHPFQLKFHNDISTSTSDIHHFCPKQYNWFHKPQGSAAIQTNLPVPTTTTIDHHEVLCTKPCHCIANPPCTCTKQTDAHLRNKCIHPKKSNTNSEMSCDESKTQVCAEKKHRKKKLSRKTRSNRECPCKEQTRVNKSVVTYADQASGCVAENGRETQTVNSVSPIIKIKSEDFNRDLELEPRMSKRFRNKENAGSRASLSGACDSTCCSGSCSCLTDVDT